MAAMVLIYAIIILVAIMLRILFASIMNGVAIKKGQAEAHAFPIVFFFGIMGCLYVVALPDLVVREQNEDILATLIEIKQGR